MAVEQTLAGESDQLKEYRIGLEVFGRSVHYDPRMDPVVRVEARRLRAKLARFYEKEGTPNGLRIVIPKGTYAAVFAATEEQRASPEAGHDAKTPAPAELNRVPDHTSSLGKWMAIVIVAATLAAGYYAMIRLTQKPRPYEAISVQKITRSGKATMAAVSPDGRYILRAVSDAGMESLWVSTVAGEGDREIVPPEPVRYRGLQFSRDGNSFYFVRSEEKNWGLGYLYRAPAQGGKPQKRITDIDSNISFSPDGRSFAFVVYNTPDDDYRVVIASVDGGAQKELTTGPLSSPLFDPAWSPDGKTIVCGTRQTGSALAGLVTINVATGSSKLFYQSNSARLSRPMWLPDGKGILVLSREQKSVFSEQQVILVSYPQGVAYPVTRDTNRYSQLSIASNGTLVATLSQSHWNLFVMRSGSAAETGSRQISSGASVQSFAWTRDNKLIVGQDFGLTLFDPSSGNQSTLMAADHRFVGQPSVCPDNRIVLAMSGTDAARAQNIWRMDAKGANLKQLTTGHLDRFPVCSGDGSSVYYEDFSENRNFWVVPLEGGPSHRVDDRVMVGCDTCVRFFDISSDGTRAVLPVWIGMEKKIAVVQLDAQASSQLLDFRHRPEYPALRFIPAGDGIAYAVREGGVDNIWIQRFDGHGWSRLTDFSADQIQEFQFSPDGTQLAVSRGHIESDIVLIRDANLQTKESK